MFNTASVSVVLALMACAACNAQSNGLDQTLQPNQGGTAVTVASILRIQASVPLGDVFSSDNRLLRRIAFVETRDGVDPSTYSDPSYDGGIWRVDERIYNETLNIADNPELPEIYQAIFASFVIDWSTTTWEDLRRPLVSALAARIFLELLDQRIPGVGDIRGQGEYWKQFYNSDPADTVDDFVSGVDEFELVECPRVGLDLAFVFDSSGSVGEVNFELEKEFAVAVVQTFAIGPNETQVGAIAYSGFADVSFVLDTFTDRQSVIQALRDIEYFDLPGNRRPSTNTADALTRLRVDVLSPSGGSRSLLSTGVARVAVVITDGRSNVNRSLTIPSALDLHNDSVLVFAVGVGDNLRLEELDAIASGPGTKFLLSDFNVMEFIGLQRTISIEACMLPVPVPIEQTIESTLEGGELGFFSFALPAQGMTLRLEVQSGAAVMYASSRVQNPSSAFYDYIIDTSESDAVFIDRATLPVSGGGGGRRRRQEEGGSEGTAAIAANFTDIVVFVTVEGVEEVNMFTLGSTFGDTSHAVGVQGKFSIVLAALAIVTVTSLWH